MWNRQLHRRFDAIVRRATRQIVAGYPRTLAIVVDGSVGRGDDGPYRDVDILAVTKPGPTPTWFSYFDDGIFGTVDFTTVKRYRIRTSGTKVSTGRVARSRPRGRRPVGDDRR